MRKGNLTLRLAVLGLGLLLAAPPPVVAADPPEAVHKSFTRFCADWMKKLAKRESDNQRQPRRLANGQVEYTGYSTTPLRCEARPSGVASNPFVGKLVYHELLYRTNGSKSRPAVYEQIEVMEIFRYDGKAWRY